MEQIHPAVDHGNVSVRVERSVVACPLVNLDRRTRDEQHQPPPGVWRIFDRCCTRLVRACPRARQGDAAARSLADSPMISPVFEDRLVSGVVHPSKLVIRLRSGQLGANPDRPRIPVVVMCALSFLRVMPGLPTAYLLVTPGLPIALLRVTLGFPIPDLLGRLPQLHRARAIRSDIQTLIRSQIRH